MANSPTSSNMMMPMMILVIVCVISCMSSMVGVFAPFAGIFGGIGSVVKGTGDLIGGAGDLVGGVAGGVGSAASGAGNFASGTGSGIEKGFTDAGNWMAGKSGKLTKAGPGDPLYERFQNIKRGICRSCRDSGWKTFSIDEGKMTGECEVRGYTAEKCAVYL